MIVHVPVVAGLLLELAGEQGGRLFQIVERTLKLARSGCTRAPPAGEEVELRDEEGSRKGRSAGGLSKGCLRYVKICGTEKALVW